MGLFKFGTKFCSFCINWFGPFGGGRLYDPAVIAYICSQILAPYNLWYCTKLQNDDILMSKVTQLILKK